MPYKLSPAGRRARIRTSRKVMQRLNADPEFKAKQSKAASRNMKRLSKRFQSDPDFRRKAAAAGSANLRRWQTSPRTKAAFRKHIKQHMERLHSDPKLVMKTLAARRKASRKRKKLHSRAINNATPSPDNPI